MYVEGKHATHSPTWQRYPQTLPVGGIRGNQIRKRKDQRGEGSFLSFASFPTLLSLTPPLALKIHNVPHVPQFCGLFSMRFWGKERKVRSKEETG